MTHGSSPLARGLRSRPRSRARRIWIIPARAGFTNRVGDCTRKARDHPRSRGVYPEIARDALLEVGSSPLARGLREAANISGAFRRIIPARAGFTDINRLTKSTKEDHPRSRGVYVLQAHHDQALSWIIPARAGFTGAGERFASSPRDHPRSRGVYAERIRKTKFGSGSSPLARGLQIGLFALSIPFRIIPARAGFTSRPHPIERYAYGSSPLARGLPDSKSRAVSQDRIIPARAGFTSKCGAPAPQSADHPRSRGVYVQVTGAAFDPKGSSPLARGLPLVAAAAEDLDGIIPARAGFTAI